MSAHAQKRMASEPVEALLGDVTAQPLTHRPLTTVLGAILVLMRGCSGATVLILVVLLWPEIEPQLDFDGVSPKTVYLVFVVTSAVTVCVLLTLVVLIWRGSNFARITAMSWLTLSIITAAVGHFMWGEQITLHTSLVLVALDVLVLLALSSKDSRAWSQLTAGERRAVLRRRRDLAG